MPDAARALATHHAGADRGVWHARVAEQRAIVRRCDAGHDVPADALARERPPGPRPPRKRYLQAPKHNLRRRQVATVTETARMHEARSPDSRQVTLIAAVGAGFLTDDVAVSILFLQGTGSGPMLAVWG